MTVSPPGGGAWPAGTVWAWRPPLRMPEGTAQGGASSGAEVAPGVKVFYAGAPGSVTLAPGESPDSDGLVLTTAPEAGAFASLVFDLPPEAIAAITRRSLVTLSGVADHTGPGDLFGRINLRHGPNISSQTRPADMTGGALLVDFDLAYAGLDHAGVTQIWVDLLLADPGASVLRLTDIAFSARPRAEF